MKGEHDKSHECIMEEKIDRLEKKVDQILEAMIGNNLGTTGVIPRLEKCENKISILNAFKNKTNLITSLISGAIATAVTFLIAYFTR